MSRKFNSIEFFGLPGSGKSYSSNLARKILKQNGYNVYNAREIVIHGSGKILNLSLFEKISINYFRLINLKNSNFKSKKIQKFRIKKEKLKPNISLELLKECYINICKKIVLRNKRFFLFEKNLKINKKISDNKKKQYLFWFYELLAAKVIFQKKKIFKKKTVMLLDEGFVQRSFTLYNITNIKNKKRFFDNYFSQLPLSDKIVLLKESIQNLKNINKKRKLYSLNKFKNFNEISSMSKFLKSYLLKQKKFQFYFADKKNLISSLNKILGIK